METGNSEKCSMEVDEAANVMASPGAKGSVSVSIHPLVIMNISDHWTRYRAAHAQREPTQVMGALLGKQNGRNIEVCNSFEMLLNKENNEDVLDMEFYTSQEDQYKQVFKNLDFVGWYMTGNDSPSKVQMNLHQQILEKINESPIFLMLHPLARGSELPIQVMESVVDIVQGQATPLFVSLSYTLATEEAERIGVDHVARVSGTGSSSDTSSVASNLQQQHSAIEMLHQRVRILLEYVRATQKGDLPFNHELMRELYSLIHRLPVTSDESFKQQFSKQCSDVSLMAYLGAMTKGCDVINQYINKFNVLYDRSTGRRMRGLLI